MNQQQYLSREHWQGTLNLLLLRLGADSFQAKRVNDAERELADDDMSYKDYRKVLFSALLNTSPFIMAEAGNNGLGTARKVMVTMASVKLLPSDLWKEADTQAYGKYYAEYERVVASVPQKAVPIEPQLNQLGETTMSVFKQIAQAEQQVVTLKKSVTADNVFDEIVSLEAERKRLDSISAKPKAIVAKIAEIDARIAEIVQFSDERHVKADDTAKA